MFPVVFWVFLAIATVRPGGIPSCPTGTYFNQATKLCVQLVDDRDIGRGDAPVLLDQRCEKE